jgi:ribosomal protein S27AE
MKSKYWWMIRTGEKVSRKTKKQTLGKRIGKSGLKKLLNSVQIIPNKYPQPATILPYPFCPKCGCSETRMTGNMADHPELWVRSYCLRCGFLVGEADNSPFVHALECYEFNYQLN